MQDVLQVAAIKIQTFSRSGCTIQATTSTCDFNQVKKYTANPSTASLQSNAVLPSQALRPPPSAFQVPEIR
jgi:hypothetical protein